MAKRVVVIQKDTSNKAPKKTIDAANFEELKEKFQTLFGVNFKGLKGESSPLSPFVKLSNGQWAMVTAFHHLDDKDIVTFAKGIRLILPFPFCLLSLKLLCCELLLNEISFATFSTTKFLILLLLSFFLSFLVSFFLLLSFFLSLKFFLSSFFFFLTDTADEEFGHQSALFELGGNEHDMCSVCKVSSSTTQHGNSFTLQSHRPGSFQWAICRRSGLSSGLLSAERLWWAMAANRCVCIWMEMLGKLILAPAGLYLGYATKLLLQLSNKMIFWSSEARMCMLCSLMDSLWG